MFFVKINDSVNVKEKQGGDWATFSTQISHEIRQIILFLDMPDSCWL
jgi:hypothetical protein